MKTGWTYTAQCTARKRDYATAATAMTVMSDLAAET